MRWLLLADTSTAESSENYSKVRKAAARQNQEVKSCPRDRAALETKPTLWVNLGHFQPKVCNPRAATNLCGRSQPRLRAFSVGLRQGTLHLHALFFPLWPHRDAPPLESTPKQDLMPTTALGTAVLALLHPFCLQSALETVSSSSSQKSDHKILPPGKAGGP